MKGKIKDVAWVLLALVVEAGAMYSVAALRQQDFGRSALFTTVFAFECLGIAVVSWLRCDAGGGPLGFFIGTVFAACLAVGLATVPAIGITAPLSWLGLSAVALTGYQVGRLGTRGRASRGRNT